MARQPYTIHLTYPIEEIDAARKKDWEKEQGKENGSGMAKKVRRRTGRPRNSLGAFFAAKGLAEGQKIDVVEKDKPHVIDLLDPLGF